MINTLIWYNAERNDYYVLKTPELKWSGVTRAECIQSASLKITSEDLNYAKANPGEWVLCPREPSLSTVTEQRNRLLQSCKNLRTYVKHYFQQYPCERIRFDLVDAATRVITDTESNAP